MADQPIKTKSMVTLSIRRIVLLHLVFMTCLLMPDSKSQADPFDTAILQGLDKVTARVSTINVPVGNAVRFGNLDIIVHECDKRPPEETPENAVFLDIAEIRSGEAARNLFRGWMFSSSPALSALEHPVYDIWVLNCENSQSSETEAETE